MNAVSIEVELGLRTALDDMVVEADFDKICALWVQLISYQLIYFRLINALNLVILALIISIPSLNFSRSLEKSEAVFIEEAR